MNKNKDVINTGFNITFCIAKDCPLKDKCKRAMKGTVQKYEGNTSFIPAPYKINDGVFECDMFWGEKLDYIKEQIKSIRTK